MAGGIPLPLAEKRMVVSLLSDADLPHVLQARLFANWNALLQETVHTRERLAGGTLCARPGQRAGLDCCRRRGGLV